MDYGFKFGLGDIVRHVVSAQQTDSDLGWIGGHEQELVLSAPFPAKKSKATAGESEAQ